MFLFCALDCLVVVVAVVAAAAVVVVSQLVDALSPVSQPQRIIQGLKTSFNSSPSQHPIRHYIKPLFSTTTLLKQFAYKVMQYIIYIPLRKNTAPYKPQIHL